MKRKELCVSENYFDIIDSNETAKFNTRFRSLTEQIQLLHTVFYSVHHDVHSFISFQFVNREFDKRKRKLFMEVADEPIILKATLLISHPFLSSSSSF